MKRLLSINNYHYRRGGADGVFLEHNRLFAERGWDVSVFCMRHPDNDPSPWERYFVETLEYGDSDGGLGKLRKGLKSVYSWEARRKLKQLMNTAGTPDICHVHNVYHHISPAILPQVHKAGVPIVMTLHDLKLACPAYKMLDRHGAICERCRGGRVHEVVRNRCMKGSLALSGLVFAEHVLHRVLRSYQNTVDRFVVPSEFYARKLEEWGFERERLQCVPNFIDTRDYVPRDRVGEGFVYFGRLAPEKGLGTAIRAAAQAGVPLHIVGDGPEESRLKELARKLEADCIFHGRRSGQALRDLIASSRACLLPSEWYENAPMSVLEAYALGVPVVGARIGGIPELVMEDETGWMFQSGSVDELTDVLATVAGLAGNRIAEMGRAARTLVEREYDSTCYVSRMDAVYDSLLAGRARGAVRSVATAAPP